MFKRAMSIKTKKQCLYPLSSQAGFSCHIKILLIISLLSLINVASAQVCYSDARMAYAELMATESRQAQSAQDRIDNAWVNINTADEGELTTLHGIGPTKAQEIILYREMFGRFNSVDELTQVHGIGPKTVENNQYRIKVD